MPTFLVTNDDGAASPMLKMLVEQLTPLGHVRVVVPTSEQSWKGKGMTRFGSVQANPFNELGVEGFTVTGTPSDCVNLGVHNLFDSPPDWVISGINIGINAGLAFLLNSGTVGAAMEGTLQGIPAVAYSQHVRHRAYQEWSTKGQITDEGALAEMQAAADWCGRIQRVITAKGMPPNTELMSVNLPYKPTPQTNIRWAGLLNNSYGQLFQKNNEGDGAEFHHSYRGEFRREGVGDADWDVVHGGEISVTPLTLRAFSPSIDIPYTFD